MGPGPGGMSRARHGHFADTPQAFKHHPAVVLGTFPLIAFRVAVAASSLSPIALNVGTYNPTTLQPYMHQFLFHSIHSDSLPTPLNTRSNHSLLLASLPSLHLGGCLLLFLPQHQRRLHSPLVFPAPARSPQA